MGRAIWETRCPLRIRPLQSVWLLTEVDEQAAVALSLVRRQRHDARHVIVEERVLLLPAHTRTEIVSSFYVLVITTNTNLAPVRDGETVSACRPKGFRLSASMQGLAEELQLFLKIDSQSAPT